MLPTLKMFQAKTEIRIVGATESFVYRVALAAGKGAAADRDLWGHQMEADLKSYNLKSIIIGFICVTAGLATLILAESVDRDLHPIIYFGLISFAPVLAIGGLLQLGYEFLLRRELIKEFEKSVRIVIHELHQIRSDIDNRIRLSHSLSEIGLCEVGPRESHFDYSDMIRSSQKLYFVFNDGRTWFSNHEYDLHARAQKAAVETHIVLAHPDSTFIASLAVKVDQSPEELRQKIRETVRMVSRISWPQDRIHIYGHMMPTAYSLIMNEERAVFVPYPVSTKADRVPCFIFAAGAADGFYGVLRRDIDNLIAKEDTKKLYPSTMI